MENKELFLRLYRSKKYPPEFEEYIFSLFIKLINALDNRLNNSNVTNKNINLLICLNYLVEEHLYNMSLMNNEYVEKFMDSSDYSKHLFLIVLDKIFFNEYLELKPSAQITKYNPLISSLTLYLNFIIDRFEHIPMNVKNLNLALKLDILKKGFFMIKSIITLICDGFETEAFSTWRTLHEIECVALTLDKNSNLAQVYYNHIQYNKMYRSKETGEKIDRFYEYIKNKLKEYNLKSKDFKKYLEYGWLYSIENWEVDYPEMKLNFRKGLQYVAGLTQYSEIYEASSEIAHGSSLLVYSNKEYYCNLTLICLYETFMRMETIFSKMLKSFEDVDSKAYFNMKNVYVDEFNKNYIKLKVIAKLKNQRKKAK